MAQRDPSTSPFTISVKAGFDAKGTWIIDVTASFKDGFPGQESDILLEARLGALLAIMEAGHEGRRLGATTACVYLDLGDGARMI